MNQRVSNWGNYPSVEADVKTFRVVSDLQNQLADHDSFITRGMGRCYGDASLGNHIISTLKFDKILSFDEVKGTLECQSGITLDDLIKFLVPRGWFLPVVPGTKYITVGGAVASDIHGKNHHVEGSFMNQVIDMQVLLASGEVATCSSTENRELFQATCGGMGLTGIVLTVKISLRKISTPYISQISVKARNLDEVFALFDTYQHSTYSVAWIDCLRSGDSIGRSILMVGEHATPQEAAGKKQADIQKQKPWLNIPFSFPGIVMNELTIRIFNFLFYHKQLRKEKRGLVTFDSFFFPLDFINNWNRMYGKAGFVQYQFVLPLENSKEGLKKILHEINRNGMGSFLAVLKLFGEGDGMLSFPMRGYTLALDFPMKPGLFTFLDYLDKIVLEYGGRIYLTKDARMDKKIFWESYPNSEAFKKIVDQVNPAFKWQSLQSDRLAITKK